MTRPNARPDAGQRASEAGSDREAIELAYGILWHVGVDTRTFAGASIAAARRVLLARLDRDGQAAGIAAATGRRDVVPAENPAAPPPDDPNHVIGNRFWRRE